MKKHTTRSNPSTTGNQAWQPDSALPAANHLPHFVNFKGICLYGQILLSYAIDVSQNKYHYIEASCPTALGYKVDFLESAGPDFYKSRIHTNDLKVYEHHILPQILQFLRKQNKNNQAAFSFSYNYRIKTKTNTCLSVLQCSTFLLHAVTGNPILEVGFVIDITHFKENDTIVFTIKQSGAKEHVKHTGVLQKHMFFPQQQLFSRREQEILQLIAEGAGSKQIAEKLFISINTINNHRKNMLYKTGSKNFVQLITYAIRNGIVGLFYFVSENCSLPYWCNIVD